MFPFLGGITFMLHKHPAESTGGYRARGIRKSRDRGPGIGGRALVHTVASWMASHWGALGGNSPRRVSMAPVCSNGSHRDTRTNFAARIPSNRRFMHHALHLQV